MEITWLQALLIAGAAYLAVSVWPFGVGYFTLYRPLVGGTIVGLILGDVRGGMAFGAALNAVHLGFISTGGSLPSDLVTAGYIGTALALASGLDVDAALATFGIPLGVLGGFLWYGRMTLGSVFAHWADARAAVGDTRGVAAFNLWAGQGLLCVFYALPTFVIVYLGQRGLDAVLHVIPQDLIAGLAVVGGMLPAVGLGLLLRSIGKPRLIPYLVVGFVLSTYLELPILVIALLGASVAWLVVGREAAPVPAGAAPERPEVQRVPRRVLWGAWRRWVMFLHASYNYERLQGLGFAHAMKPVIEYLYPDREGRAAALKRHLTFFNSEPQFGAMVPAAVIAMEEERAVVGASLDESIHGVKSGLMGPLAGVGDSLLQGTVTPLLLSMGIALAQEGRLLGPVLYVLLISAIVLASSRTFWSLGYRWGRAVVSRVLSSGWVQVLSEGAAVAGMVVLGGLTTSVVHVTTPLSFAMGQMQVSLQGDVLDTILRGMLPLALTLLVCWALVRRVPSMRVIGWLFVVGIDLSYLGLAGGVVPPLFTPEWVAFLRGDGWLLRFWLPLALTGVWLGFWVWRRAESQPQITRMDT